ncbi:thioesterase family protein [Agrobacterium sp. MCAB5]|uniref:thioesterase family protein n=1 Tax=Agrobacterium sp. MCAB5 TaxID=3233042 RepID=UPI003F91AF7B
MAREQTIHGADFKAKVALEAILGDATISELASNYGLDQTMVSSWKIKALEGMSEIFSHDAQAEAAVLEDEAYSEVCQMSLQMRWGDMDAAGHLNNTVYFRFMEQIRITWFEGLGLLGDVGHGEGPVIVDAAAAFLRQLSYPGDVLVTMSVGLPGRSSFDTRYKLSRADEPEKICATGSARCVWIDFSRQKSVPMPDSLRNTLLQARLTCAPINPGS